MALVRSHELASDAASSSRKRAAQYVRMSTEHQQYSTENQGDVIARYAESHGLAIVRTYADEGKSGLNLEGRASLQQLIADVTGGRADFEVVLVYDISRWGRFQDADQSAYYEYICRNAGVKVQYCAEQFDNDGSIGSTIIKTVKRAMAGEYSRELSTKVFAGQCRLISYGFRQGGPRRIAQSISEVGVIEPLVVASPRPGEPRHLLLDGNLRFAILQERGEARVRCLLASDDEAFTYNKRINRLATIQEHFMIVRALKRGVSEEKLARALNVDVRAIKRRRIMLDGICPEVVDLLKDRNMSSHTIEVLRKMKPMRQIQAVELMMALNNFSCAYANRCSATKRSSLSALAELA